MPKSKSNLSANLKKKLPVHAQDIYIKAFNNAWKQYKDKKARRGNEDRDTVANKVAWTAVKKKYRKSDTGKWVKK